MTTAPAPALLVISSGCHGAEGYFMLDAFVYERAGQPCRACGDAISRIVQGQRATYYCRRCQRR